MNRELADKIAAATLYEGYILYPYRPSVKNQQRWTFGGVYPRAWSEANPGSDLWEMRTEILVTGRTPSVQVIIRFLQLIDRTVQCREGAETRNVRLLEANGKRYRPWQEAMEREVDGGEYRLDELVHKVAKVEFEFPEDQTVEDIKDSNGQPVGAIVRTRQEILGAMEISARRITEETCAVSVRVWNRLAHENARSMTRDEALMRSLVSMHVMLGVSGGEFVSMTDGPDDLRKSVESCRNSGLWPVLIGTGQEHDTVLASPIILYDYPKLAPQSPGDLFDGTEIDEILTLRIMTLTDEEKREASDIDAKARELLTRSENLGQEQMMGMHGVMKESASRAAVPGESVKAGDRVRLRPLGKADIFDIALDGKLATVVSVERDFENRTYVAVAVDDDPGRDLAESGKPGHRFFFGVDEVEPVEDASLGGMP